MGNRNLLLFAFVLFFLSSKIYAEVPIETVQKYLKETLKEDYLGVRPIDSTRLMKKYLPSFHPAILRSLFCVTHRLARFLFSDPETVAL